MGASLKTPDFKLSGKVAIVTGSTRGIGNAIAKALAAYGANVVITGRNQEACDKVAAEIEALGGGKAIGVATEVTNQEHRETLISRTVEKFGRIDILVNNAGVGGKESPALTIDEEEFDYTFDADVKALYFLSTAVAKQMQAQGHEEGQNPYRIINMSSAAGIKAPRYSSVYGAAKAAVNHLTKIMANEWARYGILVNAVAPGYVVTDMTKDVRANEKNAKAVLGMISLRRYGEVEDIAGVVEFLCSPAAGYITGVLIPVDGGMTIN
jgi:NAD(P)-dependent dehydrogenase (short-subunit alcohol dehydrogenase family)